MIQLEVIQGEEDWFRARLGIPTASNFKRIITPKTLKLSAQAQEYANEKIAEIMTGETQGIMQPTYYMERGTMLEVEAGEAYEFTYSVITERGGFITDNKKHFGCSPDRLVGDKGLLEIKCMMAKHHIGYLCSQEVEPDHMPQIQGQLWLSEREWCDWWFYHPSLPRCGIRTYRDEEYIAALADALNEFRCIMNDKIERLMALGYFEIAAPPPKKPSKQDEYFSNIIDAG